MTVWDGKLMKENELSKPVKVILGVAIVIAVGIALRAVAQNAVNGVVTRPWALGMVFGFVCFLLPKLAVVREKKLVSFGTGPMTNRQENFYRLGYFLMGLGVLLAFA
jgi:hypothetical protein